MNALSTHMTTNVFRNGKVYQQEYACGKPLYPVKEVGTTDITGTRQTFWPDASIFTVTEYKYILDDVCKTLATIKDSKTGKEVDSALHYAQKFDQLYKLLEQRVGTSRQAQ